MVNTPMIFIITIITIFLLNAKLLTDKKEYFITDTEYGKFLYSKQRGISCNKCHGVNGQGTLVANYKHKGDKHRLIAPKIYDLPFNAFKIGVINAKGVMPSYSLSDEEIIAIYAYLQEINDINVTRK